MRMFRFRPLTLAVFAIGLSIGTAVLAAAPPEFRPVTPERPQSLSAVALGGGRLLAVWAPEGAPGVMGAYFGPDYESWFGPRPMVEDAQTVSSLDLLRHPESGELFLFTVEPLGGTRPASAHGVVLRRSTNEGRTWQAREMLYESPGQLLLGSATVTEGGTVVLAAAENSPDGTGAVQMVHIGDAAPERSRARIASPGGHVSAPLVVAADADGGASAYFTAGASPSRYFRARMHGARPWQGLEAVNLPSAAGPQPARTAALLRTADGWTIAAGNDNVLRTAELNVAISYDGGRVWAVRRTLDANAPDAAPTLVQDSEGVLHVLYSLGPEGIGHYAFTEDWITAQVRLSKEPRLFNVTPPLEISAHRSTPRRRGGAAPALPVADAPFIEHVRKPLAEADWPGAAQPANGLPGVEAATTTPVVTHAGREWAGAEDGLYSRAIGSDPFERHALYGADGPPSNVISGIAVDGKDTLWVATPAGLSARTPDSAWRIIRGRQGLPWEELTCIAVDSEDRVWLGSTRGVILYAPDARERQWYYRAGERYLPADHVLELAVSDDARTAFIRTAEGFSRIVEEPLTLYEKAEFIEERYNERHRRLGLASPARYDDAYEMRNWTHGPQPSDGLWTGYHVAAMSMAYSLTLDDRYLESASESMEALYLLQNVTGVHGLVARSVVAVDEPAADEVREQSNWHLTADGKYLWRDDVSSDQLDGHFLGFYTYFEHIAQFDAAKRERLERQIRQVLDYILDNNYTIPDWHGERTLWGWWTPELLNEVPMHYLESGLYSLMMLSFLKTAHYVTGDETYLDHFHYLIQEHDYLSNLLLQKKLFPDELNHSDDQLSAVAFYPILQLEYDPFIRDALHRSIRRHALIEQPERNAFFALVYGSIDPDDADVAGALRTLREMPRDRRNWRMENSHRADVVLRADPNRGGREVLLEVLPYDEHQFERWNQDPYEPDGGGNGRLGGSGEHYLIPYWIGRYHGLVAPPSE